ncbi:MAG: hypothetical protein PUP93_14165 [Rhizonema sp. NSF051]|nr:hypothetical protein [Rhizonema sp. NSF051]
MIKPSKAEVSVSEVFIPTHLNNNPIPDLPGNKEKPLSTLKYATPYAVKALLIPEAQSHITTISFVLFGDYETSADRQAWQIIRTYTRCDKFDDKLGTSLGGCTVTNIIDAETGKVLRESVVYQKDKQPPPQIDISTPPLQLIPKH